jgi:hypothetical protein
MPAYRIKHLPTGLYFCPSRHIKVGDGYVKSNLSRTGKAYLKKPTLRFLGDTVYNHLGTPRQNSIILRPVELNRPPLFHAEAFLEPVDLSQWEIEVI